MVSGPRRAEWDKPSHPLSAENLEINHRGPVRVPQEFTRETETGLILLSSEEKHILNVHDTALAGVAQ